MTSKSVPNGFYIYMQAERIRLQELNKIAPSMQDMAVICAEPWKNLSTYERARYNAIAKQDRYKLMNDPKKNRFRMDNKRQIIANRKNPVDEDLKRRNMEVQTLMKTWEGEGLELENDCHVNLAFEIFDVKFHVINFQAMYDDDPDDGYLPMEVGLVCFTLRDGIIRHMHHLINPGDAPQGNRHIAAKHSQETHQIPLCYEEASRNFLELWKEIEEFVADDPHIAEKLPLFCQKDQRICVESCLEFILYRAHLRDANTLKKVYTLEDLFISLIRQSGKTDEKPSEGQIRDSLLQNRWDTNSSIRCSYHHELDCSYCSLAIVRRFCFCLFDQLSNILNFKMTAQHMPVETSKSNFIVKYPTAHSNNFDNTKRVPIRRQRNSSSTSSIVSSQSFVSVLPQSSSSNIIESAWDAPRVNRVEVHLSDSESDNEDEALFTNEVRSTADQYSLQELRKPITPALAMPQSVSSIITSFGRGVAMLGNEAFSSRGGRGMPRCTSPVRPSPGLKSVSAASLKDFPSNFLKNPLVEPARPAPRRANIRGVGRGRGMPAQLLSFQRRT